MKQQAPILIVGSGIGGLSAAIALAQSGFFVHIVEQAPTLSEVGAGIQLGPNAARLLDRWGVSRYFKKNSVTPEKIALYDGVSGLSLANVPLGKTAEKRYGAPYYVLHRSDLQAALLQVARSEQRITLTTGFTALSYQQTPYNVTLTATDGRTIEGEALIGADGLWSAIRKQMHNVKPSPIGKTTWRTVIPATYAPDFFKRPQTTLWMAPQSHLVHYPVIGGDAINVIAVVDDAKIGIGWNNEADKADIMPSFKHWHQSPRDFLSSLSGWHKWSLFALPPLKKWSQGRITLLGDAAHPPVPFLAQGGAMAIEDAAVLASELLIAQKHYGEAFKHYEQKRIPRVLRVTQQSLKMGQIYHMKTPSRLVRNLVLRRSKSENLLKKYDWLYGFNDVA